MASPPPLLEDGAVCCMCGDHGLPRELFRCWSCRARLQHTYCSDLYPRAAAYTRCNWCLRGPPAGACGGGRAAGLATSTTTAAAGKPAATEAAAKRKAAASGSDEERRQLGLSRAGAAAVDKKRRTTEEKTPSPSLPGTGNRESDAAGGGEEALLAGKTRARARVRRYKLLAEVIISC